MGTRQYRENVVGIEPADTIIVLHNDLNRLLEFVQKVAIVPTTTANKKTLVRLIGEGTNSLRTGR